MSAFTATTIRGRRQTRFLGLACRGRTEVLPSMELLRHVGTYCWSPDGLKHKEFSEVTAEDVRVGLRNFEMPPSRIVGVEHLPLPAKFRELPPQKATSKFPLDPGFTVSLHMCGRCGVDLSEVDFLVGGSVLGFFAKKGAKDKHTKYLAQQCPGERTVIIGKCKGYTQNYASYGFQFERFVTGGQMDAKHNLRQHESLRLLRVGDFTVLCQAEIDALDEDGTPVEIKTSNPKYFDLKVVLQMASSGALALISADRRGSHLNGVRRIPIQDLVKRLRPRELELADTNVVQALSQLKGLEEAGMGTETREVNLSGDQIELRRWTAGGLLPAAKEVRKLLCKPAA